MSKKRLNVVFLGLIFWLGHLIAIVPCALGFPISLPFGIWALIVVLRHDVRNAFADENAESEREQRTKESNSVIGVTIALGVSFGVALGAAMGNIPAYLTFGVVLGILFGSVIDTNNRRESKDCRVAAPM